MSRYSLRRTERWSSVAHDETHHCRSLSDCSQGYDLSVLKKGQVYCYGGGLCHNNVGKRHP